jgi:hypothetical protein
MASTGLPAWMPPTTNWRLLGLHAPAEPMNCRLVKCELRAVSTSFRTISSSCDVREIQVDREHVSREKYTMCRPSGLIDGETSMVLFAVSFALSGAPNVCARAVACMTGEYCSRMAACQFAESSLSSMRVACLMASMASPSRTALLKIWPIKSSPYFPPM